jgi:hypothetical protein
MGAIFTMKISYLLFITLLIFLTACGNTIENVEQITLNYWEVNGKKQEDTTFTNKDEQILNIFINAVNNAEQIEEKKVIATEPILSFSMRLTDDEVKSYHLWINMNGEGYIQSLHPNVNRPSKIDKTSVADLTVFLSGKENVRITHEDIVFEK